MQPDVYTPVTVIVTEHLPSAPALFKTTRALLVSALHVYTPVTVVITEPLPSASALPESAGAWPVSAMYAASSSSRCECMLA